MKFIYKYLLTALLLLGVIFTQDNEPPYYITHPENGPSVEFDIPSEVSIENSIANFIVNFFITEWVWNDWEYFEELGIEPSALFDDSSGIQKYGYRFMSPLGEINDVFVQGDCSFINFTTSGSWAEYIYDPLADCQCGMCSWGDVPLIIPVNQLELGTYQVSFVVVDFAGNELVIDGNELANLGGSPTITFIASDNEDTEPPYYITHPENGPSVEFDIPSEVSIENSIANFIVNFFITEWVWNDWEYFEELGIEPSALFDDSSGIQKYGYRFMSPLGEINDVFVQGDCSFINFTTSGSWAEYIYDPLADCQCGMCSWGDVPLIIPVNQLELGTYQVSFVVVDFAGNELVIDGNELANLGGSPTITIIDTESQINIDEYGEVPILNWGWGAFQLVLISSDALSELDEGTNIYILDNLGIPGEGCDGDFGPIIVGNNTYQGAMETPYEIVCTQGIDLCGLNGPRLPGYVEGNIMRIYAGDNTGNTLEGEVTEYSLGEGMFGEPLTYITGINFERSDIELLDINSLETNNSRNQYRYNVYRNEELYLSAFQSVYYIDESINDNIDYCYEVYLIDNYDNSEFLSTDEVCFYSETDFLSGDVNQDGSVNVLDIVSIVGYILGSQEFNETEFYLSDYNQDGFINVLDVVAVVQVILSGL